MIGLDGGLAGLGLWGLSKGGVGRIPVFSEVLHMLSIFVPSIVRIIMRFRNRLGQSVSTGPAAWATLQHSNQNKKSPIKPKCRRHRGLNKKQISCSVLNSQPPVINGEVLQSVLHLSPDFLLRMSDQALCRML